MSSGARFFRAGFGDLEARLSRVLPPPICDDPGVIRTVESGAIGGGLTGLLQRSRAAFASSVTAEVVRRVTSSWHDAHWSARRRGAGILLIVAALVHLALGLSSSAAGWLWMVIPVLAAVVGVLAIAASVPPGAHDSR